MNSFGSFVPVTTIENSSCEIDLNLFYVDIRTIIIQPTLSSDKLSTNEVSTECHVYIGLHPFLAEQILQAKVKTQLKSIENIGRSKLYQESIPSSK